MDASDPLGVSALPLASALGVAAAVLLGISPWAGGGHTRTHAALVLALAGLVAFVAARWDDPDSPPERLARLLLVASLALVAVTQLALAVGAAGLEPAHPAGETVGRLAYPLLLLAVAGAVGAALAKSARRPL